MPVAVRAIILVLLLYTHSVSHVTRLTTALTVNLGIIKSKIGWSWGQKY